MGIVFDLCRLSHVFSFDLLARVLLTRKKATRRSALPSILICNRTPLVARLGRGALFQSR